MTMKLPTPSTSFAATPASASASAHAARARSRTERPDAARELRVPHPDDRGGARGRAHPVSSTRDEAELGPLGMVDERRHHRASGRAGFGPLEATERARAFLQLHGGDGVGHLGLEVGRQGALHADPRVDPPSSGHRPPLGDGAAAPWACRHGREPHPRATGAVLEHELVPTERGQVGLGVGVGDGDGRGHDPRNSGGRFSANAANPSTASSEVRQ